MLHTCSLLIQSGVCITICRRQRGQTDSKTTPSRRNLPGVNRSIQAGDNFCRTVKVDVEWLLIRRLRSPSQGRRLGIT